jgi:SHS2 domain-containing protein
MNTAWISAFSAVIADMDAVRLVATEYVELWATDLSALLLRWLLELNYRHVTEHRLFRRFEITQMNEESLVAVVAGEKLNPARHQIFTEIKAVTFHAMRETFGSTCHGAGRAMSRVKAKKTASGRNIIREMEAKGIILRGQSRRTVDEEISEAYKDVSNVVDACALAGISRKVAQLRPLGCIKG